MEESANAKSAEVLREVSQENDARKWSRLVAETWRDEALKHRLLRDPARVLREHGIEVRANIEVRVVENTDAISYLILPARPPGDVTELTAEALSSVAGGFANYGTQDALKRVLF